jgi:hypothetical protein
VSDPRTPNRPALDPARIETAKRRARAALAVAKHHNTQAAAERAKAEQLARVWGFIVDGDEVRDAQAVAGDYCECCDPDTDYCRNRR